MTIKEYQRKAMRTATPKCYNTANAALGLTGEAGEVADEVKKCMYQGHPWQPSKIIEELGDVLLQVVFHASLAEDTGRFDLDAVADGICKKMIFRHPHVFGSASADTTEEVLSNWDTLKREEKGIENDADALRAVARTLPALWRAEKVLKKAAKAGFAWPDISGAMDKLAEEQEELRVAVAEHTNIREELGDVLFAAAAVARYAGIDPEQALQEATDKYISRFACMERSAAEQGRSIAGMRLDEMIQAWNHAKQKLQQDTQEDKNNE